MTICITYIENHAFFNLRNLLSINCDCIPLKDDIIEESNSPWCSPIVMVKKKDGTMRFAVDFGALNARTTEVLNFPIPDLSDAIDSIGYNQSTIFSVCDLRSSFWQIKLAPETAHKTAFVTHDNCYQFKRIPYSIRNGSTQQNTRRPEDVVPQLISGRDVGDQKQTSTRRRISSRPETYVRWTSGLRRRHNVRFQTSCRRPIVVTIRRDVQTTLLGCLN